MYFLLSLFSFILGTLVGSFLNVVILRHGTGMGLGGRSRCVSSGNILKWHELIPVISFVIQKGRSRYTGVKLSWQYPIVEFLTGLLFLLSFKTAFSMFGLLHDAALVISFFFFAIVSVYIILIAVYDTKHMIIPNQFVYPLIGLSFIQLFISLPSFTFEIPSVWLLLSGPILALPFLLLWFFSKGKWMGFADSKVALVIGWFLGFSQGLFAILLSFWIGAIVGALLYAYSKVFKKKTIHHIPFGPFLLAGLILSFLYNIDIGSFMSLLYS
jgi:leader peptidase (prepilin peptidase)/N-methyltransferase